MMPANRSKTGQFVPGQSGNPSGRPKRSDAEVELLAGIYELAPRAVEVMREVLDGDAPIAIKLKVVEIVLTRIAGKPTTIAEIENNEEKIRFDWSSSLGL